MPREPDEAEVPRPGDDHLGRTGARRGGDGLPVGPRDGTAPTRRPDQASQQHRQRPEVLATGARHAGCVGLRHRLTHRVEERPSLDLLERRAERLTVVRQHDDAVPPRRPRQHALERAEHAVQPLEGAQRSGLVGPAWWATSS